MLPSLGTLEITERFFQCSGLFLRPDLAANAIVFFHLVPDRIDELIEPHFEMLFLPSCPLSYFNLVRAIAHLRGQARSVR